MSAVIKKKEQVVDEIKTKFEDSQSTIVVDYRGLNVSEITELRKQLREAGVDFKVYKNSMVRRATEATNLSELDEHLTGPTAIAFSNEDVVAPAKILHGFAKDHSALELKAGVVEGKVTGLEEIRALATLPSRDGLISMFLNVLQAPIRNFALATKAVAEQKEEQEA
ncbi:50S ribosomal protein L10 [Salisediminibacterium beveridgei]|uniref:Large ribosomal subunit protein uL10 n=1 Tax=Salisediminibacterium beveridgei TaxID=632773 RepID=A0A1D7QZZ4_9BACI|nr:50S ribosomal protein L10 [Salisediminibacterium beveridgei]AOM84572.1 LSU ribosomal protein L10p (P0) [Salisediminibacterium beveridgei]